MNRRVMDGNSSDTQDEEYRNQFQSRQIKWASGAGPLESDEEGIEDDQISQSELLGAHISNDIDSSSQSSPPLTSFHQAISGQQINNRNRRNFLGRIVGNQNQHNSSDEEDEISNTTSQEDNQTASQTSNNLRDHMIDQQNPNMNIQSLVARQANQNGIQLLQSSSNNRQNLFNRIISQQNQQIGILSQLTNRRNIIEPQLENRGEDGDIIAGTSNSYPTLIDIDENDDVVSMSDSLNIINTSSTNNIHSQIGTIIRTNHNNSNNRWNNGAELAAELLSNAYRQNQQALNSQQPLTRQQREEQKQMANQNIDEIFKCFICFGKIQDAVLCPACSKLCCRDCIKKWLTEQRQQCPHCRAHLQVHQLVNCRFVEEITAAFETLNQPIPDSQRNATLEDGTILRDGVEICKQHGARLDYYCQTCKIPICSECAMFGGEKHKDHKFMRLAEVYEKHCDVIKKEAECLKKRLKELNKHMNDVKSSIEKVTKAKEDKCKEIENFVENIQHKLNTKLKNKLLTLLNQRQTMQDEIEQLDEFHNKLNLELTKMPKTSLIKKSGDLIRQLKEIHTKEPHRFVDHEVSIDFSSDLVPEYEHSIFQIKNFSRIRQNNQSQIISDENEIVYSDPPLITKSGLTWRLKVYPNGNGIAKGNYISVFLEMLKGLPEQSTQKYEYRVEMINHRTPSAQVVREFASEFEVGECWGYNRFYRIDLLDREGYLNSEDDSITLKFFVRAPCYSQHCQDQERHIFSLQKQIDNKQKEMDLFKEKYYQLQKKLKKQQQQKLAAQKLITNSTQQVSQQNYDQENKQSQEETLSQQEDNNNDLEIANLKSAQKQIMKVNISNDQKEKQSNQENYQEEDKCTSQMFIKELKEKQKKNEQKLVSNQVSIQQAVQAQANKKQPSLKQKKSKENIVKNPFDDDKEENKVHYDEQQENQKKQNNKQSLKNSYFGQQKNSEYNSFSQGIFQLQVCKNNFQIETQIPQNNNIKQINEQFRSNNPATKSQIHSQKTQQTQKIQVQLEENKIESTQNEKNLKKNEQSQNEGMNLLINQFKQGMKHTENENFENEIKNEKKKQDKMQILFDKKSHYEKILVQGNDLIDGMIDENDQSSSDFEQNINVNQKNIFQGNHSIFYSESILKKKQSIGYDKKRDESKIEEQEYDKIINKNRKKQKKLQKDIDILNRAEVENLNCSNNSNSSLSQNEEELREKEQYRILKESLKQLQDRANQNLSNKKRDYTNNFSMSSGEEDTKIQNDQLKINPYIGKSLMEHAHINYDDGLSASDAENNTMDQDCLNIANIIYNQQSPLNNQRSILKNPHNDNLFGSPQNRNLKFQNQNERGALQSSSLKVDDKKLTDFQKKIQFEHVGNGLINKINEFDSGIILSSPECIEDQNNQEQSYIQSSFNASENVQTNIKDKGSIQKDELNFSGNKNIKISQFSKDSEFSTTQKIDNIIEANSKIEIGNILFMNHEKIQKNKDQIMQQMSNKYIVIQNEEEEKKQQEEDQANKEIQNKNQQRSNTQKIEQIRRLAQRHELKEQQLQNNQQQQKQYIQQDSSSQMRQQEINDLAGEIQESVEQSLSINQQIKNQVLRSSNCSSVNNSNYQLPPQTSQQKLASINDKVQERKKQTLQLLNNNKNALQEKVNKMTSASDMGQNVQDMDSSQNSNFINFKRVSSAINNNQKITPLKNSQSLNTSGEQITSLSNRAMIQQNNNVIVAGTITSNQKLLAGLNQLKQKRMLKQNNLNSPISQAQIYLNAGLSSNVVDNKNIDSNNS